jgi:hypothetical protein
MIHVAAGHLAKMQEKEAELRSHGYKHVGSSSKVEPMEYSKNEDFAAGSWSFTLTWNDPSGSSLSHW